MAGPSDRTCKPGSAGRDDFLLALFRPTGQNRRSYPDRSGESGRHSSRPPAARRASEDGRPLFGDSFPSSAVVQLCPCARSGAPHRVMPRLRQQYAPQIIAGHLGGPGARIPSEPEIIDTYGVSKATASEALKMLSAEGLIVRRSGAGSFITAHPPQLQTVQICPGTRISARPANAEDFVGSFKDIPPGVPALVVEMPGRPVRVYPADRTHLVVLAQLRQTRP
jgi:Bacterial regulatory proteins, gntR family